MLAWIRTAVLLIAFRFTIVQFFERMQETLKNRILLENYYLPGDLEQKISDFCPAAAPLRHTGWLEERRISG